MLATAPKSKKKSKQRKGQGPKPNPDVKQVLKRMEEQHKLGERFLLRPRAVLAADLLCAEIQAKLKSERETLHEQERELEELKNDLTNLAVGGFAERLPFGNKPAADATKPAEPAPAAPQADADAWKSVRAKRRQVAQRADVRHLVLLADGKLKAGPQKGQQRHVRTDLTPHVGQGQPHAKLTDITGVGTEKANAIEAACEKYWAKHPPATAGAQSEAKLLKWKEDDETDPPMIVAANTAGTEIGEGVPASFVLKPKKGGGVENASDGVLLPNPYAASFTSLDSAKAWCEAHNAELVRDAKDGKK